MNQKNWIQGIGITITIVILIILVLIPIIDYYNKLDKSDCNLYEINFSCELSNNSTTVFELFIGGIFALILSIFFYRRQKNLKEKRFTFAINRIQNQLYDLEPELQNLFGLLNRAHRLWVSSIPEQQENFTSIINARKNDLRRSLESLQSTIRISFDVLDPMLATRIDYFSRNGIEYCTANNDFDLLLEQFELLNNTRENILSDLPYVERVNTDIFTNFFRL